MSAPTLGRSLSVLLSLSAAEPQPTITQSSIRDGGDPNAALGEIEDRVQHCNRLKFERRVRVIRHQCQPTRRRFNMPAAGGRAPLRHSGATAKADAAYDEALQIGRNASKAEGSDAWFTHLLLAETLWRKATLAAGPQKRELLIEAQALAADVAGRDKLPPDRRDLPEQIARALQE